jgi:hypothetical protein
VTLFFREYFPRPETRRRFTTFSDKELCHIERVEYLLGDGQTFAELYRNGTGMNLIEAVEQANAEFYPPKRARRAPLEVRGEGEGRHTMMMAEIAAMWDGLMDEDEFVQKAMVVNAEFCHPPKPEEKIRDQVRWIMKRKAAAQAGPVIRIGSSGMGGWINAAMKRSK